jgi:uncharacterized protein (DUF488 family)
MTKQAPPQERDWPKDAIFTVGHSTLPLQDFIALLDAYGIASLADIRTVPRSRHNPQFNSDTLEAALGAHGIKYVPLRSLGGLRHARKDSPNTGWRNASFRGYADYMQTPEFDRALTELIGWASARSLASRGGVSPLAERESLRSSARSLASGGGAPRAVIMCAEAVWWRCHRQLVADALVARGVTVRHIMSRDPAVVHVLTDFARVADGRVTYPGLI